MAEKKGMVVAVGGPPHSGKSVFLAALYVFLAARGIKFFLQRACPDGEGVWSAETDPRIVAEIRRKGSFSQEFMLFTLKSIENLGKTVPLVLLDLGGRRTAENAEILKRSSYLIILSSKKEENDAWVEFARAEGCETIAIFESRLIKGMDGNLDNTVRSSVDFSAELVQGFLFNLDREGPKDPYIEVVSQFADWLIARSSEQETS